MVEYTSDKCKVSSSNLLGLSNYKKNIYMLENMNNIMKDYFLLAGKKTGLGMEFLSYDINIFFIFIFSTFLFLIGLFGVLTMTHNLIITLMSLEMMLLGVSVDFLVISYYYMDVVGHIFALVILTLAAAESAIALAIFINIYRVYKSLDIKKITKMSG